ncbi:MAG: FAD-dependent oxidoreductase [Acidimicrobiales bacterium]
MERAFRERLPMLDDVAFATRWGGWIGMNTTMLPSLGTTGSNDNIHYGIGFAGHGATQAVLMGSVLADRIQGRENEWDGVLRRWTPAVPEPFRWLVDKTVNAAYEAIDRRTDRQIREDYG